MIARTFLLVCAVVAALLAFNAAATGDVRYALLFLGASVVLSFLTFGYRAAGDV
jgi:hypothetical protein